MKEKGDCDRARDRLLEAVSVFVGAWEEDLLCLLFDMERPRASSFDALSLVLVRDKDSVMPPIIELSDLPKELDFEPSLMEGCDEVVRSRACPRVPSAVG